MQCSPVYAERQQAGAGVRVCACRGMLRPCKNPCLLRRARLHLLLAAVWRMGTCLPSDSGRPGGRRYVAAQARSAN